MDLDNLTYDNNITYDTRSAHYLKCYQKDFKETEDYLFNHDQYCWLDVELFVIHILDTGKCMYYSYNSEGNLVFEKEV